MKMPHTQFWFPCSPFSSFACSLLLIDDSAVKEWVSAEPLSVQPQVTQLACIPVFTLKD